MDGMDFYLVLVFRSGHCSRLVGSLVRDDHGSFGHGCHFDHFCRKCYSEPLERLGKLTDDIWVKAAICNAIPTVLNGAIGANLHIPFPIAIRASYGYWFSYFCVITRAILALFWFGVQTAYGAQCVTGMVTAIWPSYADIPNNLPASAKITTQGMVSYFLYWLLQL